MKKRNNRSILVNVLLVMGMVFGLAVLNSAYAANVITVGTIMPVSGPLSVVGITWDKGFELAADAINAGGGITLDGKSYTIKLIQEDSKASAEAARSAALKLVHRDKVNFVIGGILEPAVEAMYKVCDKAGIFFGMANANIPGHPADVSPDKKLQARLFHSYDATHAIDIDYVKSAYPNVKTIAISAPEIGYEPMIEDLTKKAEAKGLKIVLVEKWQWGTVDFLPTFTRVLASSPDAIWAMVSGQAQYQMMAARQLGFNGPFISNSPLAGEVFVRVAGKDACHDLIVNAVNTQDTNDAVKKVMAMWDKKYGGEFISDALLAYDALWVLAQVVQKSQSLKGNEVMATLETMTSIGDIQTVHGPARFGGMEKYGCNRVLVRPIPLSHFQGDKVVATKFIQP